MKSGDLYQGGDAILRLNEELRKSYGHRLTALCIQEEGVIDALFIEWVGYLFQAKVQGNPDIEDAVVFIGIDYVHNYRDAMLSMANGKTDVETVTEYLKIVPLSDVDIKGNHYSYPSITFYQDPKRSALLTYPDSDVSVEIPSPAAMAVGDKTRRPTESKTRKAISINDSFTRTMESGDSWLTTEFNKKGLFPRIVNQKSFGLNDRRAAESILQAARAVESDLELESISPR